MYKELYFSLFNAVTDAIEELDARNYGKARMLLVKGQVDAEEQYMDAGFLRVSKSTLLNISKVTGYTPDSDRTMLATLAGNVKIRISRKFASEFKARMADI